VPYVAPLAPRHPAAVAAVSVGLSPRTGTDVYVGLVVCVVSV